MQRMTGEPVIIVDTREWRRPYRFPRSEVRTLATGDYSLAGFEDHGVVVERKTKVDLFSSLWKKRLKREIRRMAEYEYAAIVIEANLEDLLYPPAFSLMKPRAVISTLISWSIKYGIHVYFAGNRERGNKLTQRILEKFWRYQNVSNGGC
jgi:ERCC4-type nuclease